MQTRIISGLIMGFVVISAIFYAPAYVFNALVLVIMLGGLFEWKRLCGASNGAYLVATLALIALYTVYSASYLSNNMTFVLLGVGVFLWLFNTFKLSTPLANLNNSCLPIGTLSLGLAWLAMVMLRNEFGPNTLMLVLLIIWSADSFAYFGGKKFGKTKLAPAISPGKTQEGVASGVLMAMIIAVCFTHWVVAPLSSFSQIFMLLIITILVALISVVGDLCESKLKRAAGMKDSGSLIPGHGGILDRIDGLIAGVVVYAFYAILIERIF